LTRIGQLRLQLPGLRVCLSVELRHSGALNGAENLSGIEGARTER